MGRMQYPASLIEQFGSAAAFAEAAKTHPLAPRRMDGARRNLDAAAVYMWKQRDTVPHMWRPVVDDLSAARGAA